MRHSEVFVPNDQPIHTYVTRDNQKLEKDIEDYIHTDNIVISISGPSKTGKTVLFKKAVNEENIIPVPGSSVESIFDFWSVVFSWIGEPITVVQASETKIEGKLSGTYEGKSSLLVMSAKFGGSGEVGASKTKSVQKSEPFNPFTKIVDEIGKSDFIIFIDDFHYIPKDTQERLAKIIKSLAESGVKVCTASVPHRSDDVVRANPELRGRLATVDVGAWSVSELEVIGKKGFPLLNADIAPAVLRRLASESFGSPQLMQALCLNLCRLKEIRETFSDLKRVEITIPEVENVMEDTSSFANFSSLLSALHNGPKKHGKDRKIFRFTDGSKGDVYRATLLAVASGEPKREFSYDEIMTRVKSVCQDEAPVGSSVQGALVHIHSISSDMSTTPVLEWDEDILTITDPYFAFYLRSSKRLRELERKDQ
jgi:hypothetical protein